MGIGTNTPNSNAKLDIVDSIRGILIPRVDSLHRKAIPNTKGLLIYDTNYNSFWYNNGSTWLNIGAAGSSSSTNNNQINQPIDADGNVYPMTQIGTQLWMAANLKTTHYANGDSIPNITDDNQWTGLTTGAWCYYDNDINNNFLYGKLYNWYAATDARKLCPIGWHLPTDDEWTTLYNYINGVDTVLKTAGNTPWFTRPATNPSHGNNSTGFSAVAAGKRSKPIPPVGTIDSFVDKNYETAWWTSKSEISTNPPIVLYGRFWYLSSDGSFLYTDWYTAESGFSIRCVKD